MKKRIVKVRDDCEIEWTWDGERFFVDFPGADLNNGYRAITMREALRCMRGPNAVAGFSVVARSEFIREVLYGAEMNDRIIP